MLRLAVALALPLLLALGVTACGGGPIEPTYDNVESLISDSCAFSDTCHGGSGAGQARMNFARRIAAGEPVTMELVDVPSCEYDFFNRVEPGDPDQSWLMIKVAHDFDSRGTILFTADPGWDTGLTPNPDGTLPPSVCPLTDDGELTFGANMPDTIGRPEPLPERQIALLRDWIALGAPGP